jgi:hypothetical protein
MFMKTISVKKCEWLQANVPSWVTVDDRYQQELRRCQSLTSKITALNSCHDVIYVNIQHPIIFQHRCSQCGDSWVWWNNSVNRRPVYEQVGQCEEVLAFDLAHDLKRIIQNFYRPELERDAEGKRQLREREDRKIKLLEQQAQQQALVDNRKRQLEQAKTGLLIAEHEALRTRIRYWAGPAEYAAPNPMQFRPTAKPSINVIHKSFARVQRDYYGKPLSTLL